MKSPTNELKHFAKMPASGSVNLCTGSFHLELSLALLRPENVLDTPRCGDLNAAGVMDRTIFRSVCTNF